MPHHHSFASTALRLFAQRIVLGKGEKTLHTRKGFSASCEFCEASVVNEYAHSDHCRSKLFLLDIPDTHADLVYYWDMGYCLKKAPPFPSQGTNIAYEMGSRCRGTYYDDKPSFIAEAIPA